MQNNLISAAIAPADKQAIVNDIADIQTKLAPVLVFNFTPQDRLSLLKMGDRTLAFVEKTLSYAAANPGIVPAFLDVTEADKDYTLARDLYGIYQQLAALLHSLEDAMMLSGGEAYDAALIFYNAVKGATRSNVAGSQAIYDDLKERFPRKPKAKAETPQS